MKIIIINHNPKQSGTYFRCFGFAKELAAGGHNVYFFCLRRERWYLPKWYWECGISFIELPYFFRAGWPELPGHMLRGLFIFLFALFRKVDIVHSFNVASPMVGVSTFLLFLIKRIKGIKLIVDWDDWWGKGGLTTLNQQGKIQEFIADLLETKIPLMADKVTTHNDVILQRALSVGVKPEVIHKIYNGCNMDEYKLFHHQDPEALEKLRKELGLPEDKIIFFFSGSIVTSVPFLLKVFARLKERSPKFHLLIAGPIAKEHKELRVSLVLEDHVTFLGVVAYSSYKKYIVASDILLLPRSNKSLLERCTFPGRLGDYLCAGKPIVASDVGELKNIFQDDRFGILVPSDDEDAFCDAVLGLINQPDRRKEMGRNSLELAYGRLNWKVLTSELIDHVYCGGDESPLENGVPYA